MEGALKAIIEAGKRSLDFCAFALVALIAAGALISRVPFWEAAGIACVLCFLWVACRYALVSLQAQERLRDINDRATIEAQKKLETYATEDEIADLFRYREPQGGSDER